MTRTPIRLMENTEETSLRREFVDDEPIGLARRLLHIAIIVGTFAEMFLLPGACAFRSPGGLYPEWGYCAMLTSAQFVLCVLALRGERRVGRRILALWCLGGTLATLFLLGDAYYYDLMYDPRFGFLPEGR